MDRVDQVLQKAQARLSVPQGGSVPPPMNQGVQGLMDYVGRNQQQQYIPFAPGTPTLSGKQFALQESEKTGYYAPAEMRGLLDKIQQNKQLNMTTQDESQRQQAQAQNHALYGQLQSRYGIDGENLFNTEDSKQNVLNMADAYKGMPTIQKQQNDWENDYKQKAFNADQQYKQSAMGLDKQRLGLQQEEFNFNKSKYNLSESQRKATSGYISEIMTNAKDRNSAMDYLKQNKDHIVNDGGDVPTLMKWIDDMYPQSRGATPKQIPIPSYDPDKWKNEQEYWDFVNRAYGNPK